MKLEGRGGGNKILGVRRESQIHQPRKTRMHHPGAGTSSPGVTLSSRSSNITRWDRVLTTNAGVTDGTELIGHPHQLVSTPGVRISELC